MIQEKGKKFAGELGLQDFKGSNGWLGSLLRHNYIVFRTQSGERDEVKLDTVCQGYEPKDIFNMDESGIFFKDSTKSTFLKKGRYTGYLLPIVVDEKQTYLYEHPQRQFERK